MAFNITKILDKINVEVDDKRITGVVARQDAVERSVNELLDNQVVQGVMATDIENKLKAKETEYSPRLTNAEIQVSKNSNQISNNFNASRSIVLQNARNLKTPRPSITFIDDDGNSGVLTKLKPLFTSRNVPIGLALQGNSPVVTDPEKRAQILELQNDYGWEILSHTMTHINYSSSTREEVEADCINFINTFNQFGLNVNSIAYTWGSSGPHGDIISDYFIAGFSTYGGVLGSMTDNIYNIYRFGLGSEMSSEYNTLEAFKTLIDTAIANNYWIVFMLHCDYPDNDMQLIEDVLDYAIFKGVEIVAPNEGLKAFGSVIQSGKRGSGEYYFSVKPNGVIDTNRYDLTTLKPSTTLESAPPTLKPSKRVGINIFAVSGWTKGTGIVIEYTYTADGTYQEFRRDATNVQIFHRKWVGSAWTEWEKAVTAPTKTTHTITSRTIAANSSIDISISNTKFNTLNLYIAKPVGQLETGLVWECWCYGNGAIILRLANITNAPITTIERIWDIHWVYGV